MKVIRKKTRGKMCGLTILVMVLSFFGGISFVSVIAYADEVSVQVPYVSGFTSDSVYVEAVSGQEYIIVESGETPDWSKAMITDEGYLVFEDLTPATEYTVYTRVKKTENIPVSESVKTNVLIMLNGYETQGESKTGETITIIPDPENTEGLTWQWYYAQENVDGVVEKGEAIEGNVNDTMSAYDIHGLTRKITARMYERHGIIMTVGVYAVATGENRRAELQSQVMQTLAAHKEIVQVHGFYYSEKENMLSVDVVPDVSVHDDAALVRLLIAEIQPLAPGMQVGIVVDHNYSE